MPRYQQKSFFGPNANASTASCLRRSIALSPQDTVEKQMLASWRYVARFATSTRCRFGFYRSGILDFGDAQDRELRRRFSEVAGSLPELELAAQPPIEKRGFMSGYLLDTDNPERSISVSRRFCPAFQIVPFDYGAAERAAAIRADLAARGERIGAYDMLIAGIALERVDALWRLIM
jgi:hypothetical protein